MLWMNEYDVEDAMRQFAGDEVMGPATMTLYHLMDWTNHNSDGWPYWQKPSRAAASLMTLITGEQNRVRRRDPRDPQGPTAADVRKAYTPIKAFLTRQGVISSPIVVPV